MYIRLLDNRPKLREYLLVIGILFAIGIIESRNVLWLVISTSGSGDFSVTTLPFDWLAKFHYAPLVLLDWFRLPSAVAVAVLLAFYQVIGGIFAYFLAKQYISPEVSENRTLAVGIPLLAAIAYMMFPWNTFGDNFPTLVLVRALAPLVLLFLLLSLRSGSLRLGVLSGLFLALITLADPRSSLFIIPISFLIISVPELTIKSITPRRALKVNAVFIITVVLMSLVEYIYRLPGIVANEAGARSTSGVVATLNPGSFIPNFVYANPLNYLGGISYEATYRDFIGYSIQFGSPLPLILVASSLIIFLLLYSIFFLESKKSRFMILPIIIGLVVSIALFSTLPGQDLPVLYNFLLSSDLVRNSPLLSTIVIMFRKTRFANLYVLLSLIPLISIVLGDFFYKVIRTRFTWPINFSKREIIAITLVCALILSSVAVWTAPQLARGNGLQFYGGQTFEITNESIDMSNLIGQIDQNPTIDKILVIQPINQGLPNMYTLQDIEGGTVQYIVHYLVDTTYSPLIWEGDYRFMGDVLQKLGIKYVIVDGYMIQSDSYSTSELGSESIETPTYESIISGLENSTAFDRVAEKGNITAFRVADQMANANPYGFFVLGGMEDFRKAYPYLMEQTDNGSLYPVMLDSYFPVDSWSDLPKWPIVVGAHKGFTDLAASMAVLSSEGTLLTPSSWIVKSWNPHDNWSPGYIQDRIGGQWSPIIQSVPNFDWSYSYQPDFGYAYTFNAHDMISKEMNFPTGNYVVLARTLHSPEGGEVDLRINGLSYRMKTNWTQESSDFLWTVVDSKAHLSGETQFDLMNVKGTNAIGTILVLPKDEWESIQKEATDFASQRTIVCDVDPSRLGWNSTSTSSSGLIQPVVDGDYEVSSWNNEANVTIADNNFTKLGNSSVKVPISGDSNITFWNYLTTVYSEQFENKQDVGVKGDSSWSHPGLYYSGAFDSVNKTTGNSSYAVSTDSPRGDMWSDVKSPGIPVTPGSQYVISMDMKTKNSVKSHLSIEGIRWDGLDYPLDSITNEREGDSNWKSYSTVIRVPQQTTGIRLILDAGGVYNGIDGVSTTWFDNITVQKASNVSEGLVLSKGQDFMVDGGLSIANQSISVGEGFANSYSFTASGQGWTFRSIPEDYYSASLSPESDGLRYRFLPTYYTTTGLVITGNDNSTSSLVIEESSATMIDFISTVTLSAIALSVVIIGISMIWGRFKWTTRR